PFPVKNTTTKSPTRRIFALENLTRNLRARTCVHARSEQYVFQPPYFTSQAKGAFTVVYIHGSLGERTKYFNGVLLHTHIIRRHVEEQTTTCAISRPIQSLHRSTVREELPVPQVGLKKSTIDRNASSKCCSSSCGAEGYLFPHVKRRISPGTCVRVVRFSSWGFVTPALRERLRVQLSPLTRTGHSLPSTCCSL
ncbi:unnamed protein product, partial [Ectocarpus sp. 8 AP-2014]